MSRTTQFVGLTDRATQFVGRLKIVSSDTTTVGMCGETVPLRKWECETKSLCQNCQQECKAIREIVQVSPWSNGLMVFTCLEIEFANGQRVPICQWVACPLIGRQFDAKEGIFWV